MSLAGVDPVTRRTHDVESRDVTGGFDSLDFRRAMGRFPTGVTVVTMRGADDTYGITVNAFMSVSLDPPLVAISLDKAARAHSTLAASERFGISVLGEDQRDVSDRFAGRRVPTGPRPFVEFIGFPVIEGAVAHIVCRMHSRFEAGDHTIFVGEVEALRSDDGKPLVFHGGRYERLEARVSQTR